MSLVASPSVIVDEIGKVVITFAQGTASCQGFFLSLLLVFSCYLVIVFVVVIVFSSILIILPLPQLKNLPVAVTCLEGEQEEQEEKEK